MDLGWIAAAINPRLKAGTPSAFDGPLGEPAAARDEQRAVGAKKDRGRWLVRGLLGFKLCRLANFEGVGSLLPLGTSLGDENL